MINMNSAEIPMSSYQHQQNNEHGQGQYGSSGVVSMMSEEDTDRGVGAFAYFFIIWVVLLLLVIVSICRLTVDFCTCNSNMIGDKQEQRTTDDVEATQTSTSARQEQANQDARTKDNTDWVNFTIMLIGGIIALGLSIYSILTCKFVDLDSPINFNTRQYYGYLSNTRQYGYLSITSYSLGLWSVDIGNNSAPSGCFKAKDILPFFDWAYILARASAVIAIIFGGFYLLQLILIFVSYLLMFRIRRQYFVCPLIFAILFQFMTLSLFGSKYCHNERRFESENTCKLSHGAVTCITSAIYWIFGVFVSVYLPLYK